MNDLLESVIRQENVESPFEIVIVDNNLKSVNELQDLAKSWSQKISIRVIHAKENGLHIARHAGAKAAQGSVLIFIDDDVILLPEWLANYEKFFKAPKSNCAGGKVLPKWETEPDLSAISLSPNYFSLLDYGESELILNQKQGINGCNFAITKDALFAYGGFNPDGYADVSRQWYRGDGEYGLVQKIKKAGDKVYYLPKAALLHRIPKSRLEEKAIRRMVENHAISSAYSYVRRKQATVFSLITLILAGIIFSSYYKMRSLFRWKPEQKTVDDYEAVRFFTISYYGVKVLRDVEMKKYILRNNYLEE